MGDYELAKEELRRQKFKYLNIGIFIGLILIATIFVFVFFTNIPNFFLVLLIVIFLVFYSIVLFFLIEQLKIMEIEFETERIRTIEKYTTIDNPTIERVEVNRQSITNIPVPVYIHTKTKIPQGKRYKYFASKDAKIFHHSSSRLARLIRPKNRIFSDSPDFFINKGYKPSARTLKRWKTEEKSLYEKYKKIKPAIKFIKKKRI